MKKLLVLLFVPVLVAALSVSAMAAETELKDSAITAAVLVSDPDKEIAALEGYAIDIPAGDVDVVQPITVSQMGKLLIQAESKISKQRYLELYSDETCTIPVDDGYRFILPSESKLYSFPIPKAGTYYLKIYPQYAFNTDTASGSLIVKAALVSAANRTLKSGQYTVAPPYQDDQMTYFKISVAEAGYIGFHQKNAVGNADRFFLCDKSKKEIAGNLVGASNLYYPVKKGTYYIKSEGISKYHGDWYRLKYTFYKQTSSTFTMTNNKTKKVSAFSESALYLRFKAEKTGTLTLTNSGNSFAEVVLCNSKKSALTGAKTLFSDSAYHYAVTKGTTYYLKVSTAGDVALKYKIAGVSTGSNTTKAKAVTLSKNKTKKFNFIAGSTKSYWFKFKASSSVELNMDCVFSGSGNYDVVLYEGSKKYTGTTFGNHTGIIYTTTKLSKGKTYYLKFTPKKLTTGTIALKLNS